MRPPSINIQYDQILQTEQRAGTIYHVMLGSTLPTTSSHQVKAHRSNEDRIVPAC